MRVTGVYSNIFENNGRFVAQVNLGLVADNSTGTSILSKVMDRSQAVHFLNVARRSFETEQEAKQYCEQKEKELQSVLSDLEKELSEGGAKLITFTSEHPLRTRNQKRFGIPAQHNEFAGRYTIRRVYVPEIHGELTDYITQLFGVNEFSHDLRENGERIVFNIHEPINAEDASKVVQSIVDIVEEQEI